MPFARVLADSLRKHHPECRFFVGLADELSAEFDLRGEPFTVLTPDQLGVPDLQGLAFRMRQREFAIALKPFLLARLLEEGTSALFLDPDVLVLDDLGSLLDETGRHALTLVPHVLQPPSTADAIERELVLHQAGVYNGGVIGVRRDESAARFLSWWQKRVHRLCTYAVDRGIHYDQRWLDLAPGFVQDTYMHRDVGVDVAHWNLSERPIRMSNGRITAGGAPCRLFHFSGFDPDRPDQPTRHRPQLQLEDVGDGRHLFRTYADALRRAGWEQARDLPYAYATFDNSVPIPDAARHVFAQLEDRALGDPFATQGTDSYFSWLREGQPNRLWLFVHEVRPDLQSAFPRPRGWDRRRFLKWMRKHGVHEHNVPPELL